MIEVVFITGEHRQTEYHTSMADASLRAKALGWSIESYRKVDTSESVR